MKEIFIALIILLVIIFIYILFIEKINHVKKNNIVEEKNTKLSPKKFLAKAKNEKYIVLDIRTPGEIQERKLAESTLEINFYDEDFQDQISILDREQKYLIYCKFGKRSGLTVKIMRDLGFEEVYDLDGGIDAV